MTMRWFRIAAIGVLCASCMHLFGATTANAQSDDLDKALMLSTLNKAVEPHVEQTLKIQLKALQTLMAQVMAAQAQAYRSKTAADEAIQAEQLDALREMVLKVLALSAQVDATLLAAQQAQGLQVASDEAILAATDGDGAVLESGAETPAGTAAGSEALNPEPSLASDAPGSSATEGALGMATTDTARQAMDAFDLVQSQLSNALDQLPAPAGQTMAAVDAASEAAKAAMEQVFPLTPETPADTLDGEFQMEGAVPQTVPTTAPAGAGMPASGGGGAGGKSISGASSGMPSTGGAASSGSAGSGAMASGNASGSAASAAPAAVSAPTNNTANDSMTAAAADAPAILQMQTVAPPGSQPQSGSTGSGAGGAAGGGGAAPATSSAPAGSGGAAAPAMPSAGGSAGAVPPSAAQTAGGSGAPAPAPAAAGTGSGAATLPPQPPIPQSGAGPSAGGATAPAGGSLQSADQMPTVTAPAQGSTPTPSVDQAQAELVDAFQDQTAQHPEGAPIADSVEHYQDMADQLQAELVNELAQLEAVEGQTVDELMAVTDPDIQAGLDEFDMEAGEAETGETFYDTVKNVLDTIEQYIGLAEQVVGIAERIKALFGGSEDALTENGNDTTMDDLQKAYAQGWEKCLVEKQDMPEKHEAPTKHDLGVRRLPWAN